MSVYDIGGMTVGVDFEKGTVYSVCLNGIERIAGSAPLFRVGLRDKAGSLTVTDAFAAEKADLSHNGALYILGKIKVNVTASTEQGRLAWRISADPGSGDFFVEWVEFPLAVFPALRENNSKGNGGTVLFPYNEGVLVSDYEPRDRSAFYHWPLQYPSYGSLAMFPNMICAQMLAYLWNDGGIYFGAHDKNRGLKGIDYYKNGEGIEMRFRLYSGADFGETFAPDYPVVWAPCGSDWQTAAAIYREFFEKNLPPRVRPVRDNTDLPDWYKESPLVVSYPVRGVHDTDKMDPNALFPYVNGLPVIDSIKEKTKAKILVLLMHWEGTAPWAPPYVWPPYGGEKPFFDFLSELRKRDALLGVYCSGFGYTLKSNLVDNYDKTEEFEKEGLEDSMCAGPDGIVLKSNICPSQRSGYDICPAAPKSKEILANAYTPLFESGIDYAQILDQNHGGGQYLCYGRNHGHPPAPGRWMTENMQKLLTSWNEKAGKMLLGCESAASEPFIGNLQFSDNRFELNYFIGTPAPLYAFLYHSYVRNFMGNQVCCPLERNHVTLNYRLGYSFAAGDCMTVVLTPDGNIMSNWGTSDFSLLPDKEKVLGFIANLTDFYRKKAAGYLYCGRMIHVPGFKTESETFDCTYAGRKIHLPGIISTFWEADDGSKALIAVNPFDKRKSFEFRGKKYYVNGLRARILKI